MIESALAAKRKLTFGAIGKDEEHVHRRTKVFQERRLPQQPHKRLAPGDELLVRRIGGDQAKIDVGVRISPAPSVRAAEKRGYHPLIRLARRDKAIQEGPVVMRQL